MDMWDLRHRIYRGVADTGSLPTRDLIHEWVGDPDLADALLAKMHEQHLIVLNGEGEVHMALPFAAADTGHRVRTDDRSWWANCAWDALAIPAVLGVDARIDATWLDTDEPLELVVRDGQLISSTTGFVHYAIPARSWWDDIVET